MRKSWRSLKLKKLLPNNLLTYKQRPSAISRELSTMRKKRKPRRLKPRHPCPCKQGKGRKKSVRISARQAFRGTRSLSNSREARANKILWDKRFTDQDASGWFRLKLRRTWNLTTRYGTVELVTVTGGFDKVVKTRKGKRRYFVAWKEAQQFLSIPDDISQEELEKTLNQDLMEAFVEAPFWELKHLANWNPCTQDVVHKPLKHERLTHEQYESLPTGKRNMI